MTVRERLEPGRGRRQGPCEPLPVQSKRGPVSDKLCLMRPCGLRQEVIRTTHWYFSSLSTEKSHAACILGFDLKSPSNLSPMPGQKNARNVDAFHWVSPPTKQTAAVGQGAALIRPGLLEAASWAEVF